MTSELKVDKITPASGTNTQIGEAGDTTNLSAGTVTLPTSIITGASEKTTLVDADKFLIADSADSNAFKHVQKSNLPSGGLVLVGGSEGTSDVSEVNIDNCFTATYKQYVVRVIIAPDANSDIRFRFRTGGASGSTRTNSDHFWLSESMWRSESDGSQGESLASAHGDDKFKISYDTGYDSNAALTAATINFYDPYGSQFSRQYWNALSFFQYYTGGKNYGGHFHGKTQSNVTATGLNFSPSSGNIYYHSIKVYGMVNS